jgi:hypothetical protein
MEVDLKPPSVSHDCLIAGHVDPQHVIISPEAYVTTAGTVCIQSTVKEYTNPDHTLEPSVYHEGSSFYHRTVSISLRT